MRTPPPPIDVEEVRLVSNDDATHIDIQADRSLTPNWLIKVPSSNRARAVLSVHVEVCPVYLWESYLYEEILL
jgi:hypothetical protein